MNKAKVSTLMVALAALGFGVIGTPNRSVSASETAIKEKSLQTLPSQNRPSDKSDASAAEAGSEFSNGGKSLGRGFVKGTWLTGQVFKKAGMTMATGFKKAGRAIHGYFTGNSEPEIQENDLGSSQEFDAVGNESPKKPAGSAQN